MDFLDDIIAYKKQLLKDKKGYFDILRRNAEPTRLNRYRVFKQEISKPGRLNLIAEIKKASPSQGLIRDDFDVHKIAKVYVDNGADAISVLTEDRFFLGKPAYLRAVRQHFDVPLLTKDFIIDEVQIYQAYNNGAAAILLIVAILDDAALSRLLAAAARLDLDCLVEVHDAEELDRALAAGAEIIGINNRNLHTFVVDLKVGLDLAPRVPADKVLVIESGIRTADDIARIKGAGAHAVLIGETFMRAEDIGAKMKEIMG